MKAFFILFCIFFYSILNANIQLTKDEKEFLQNHALITYSDKDWHPLFSIENNKSKGIVSDYIKNIESILGIKFQYIQTKNINDLHNKFENNQIAMISSIDYKNSFKTKYFKSDYYVKYPMVIITDNKYKYIDNLDILKNKTVAMINIPPAVKNIKENHSNINIKIVPSIADGLLLLENDEIDAFMGHIAPAIYNLHRHNHKDLKISGTVDFEYKHMFLLNKQYEKLIPILNKAINSIENPQKSEIYSKWVKSISTEKIIDYDLFYKFLFFFSIIIVILVYKNYEIKKINKELKNSNYKIESILNSTLEGLIISENSKISKTNNQSLEMLGYENTRELLGKDLLTIVADESKDLARNKAKSKDIEPYEVNLQRADGSRFPALVKGRDIIIDEKTIRISSLVDISHLKKQEILLLHQSKMAALGEMIGNIAHHWRQPLSLITTHASAVKLKKDFGILENSDIDEATEAIINSSNQLSKVIDDFKDYIKGDKILEEFYLDEFISNKLKLSQFKQNNIQIDFQNEQKIKIYSYKSELSKVLENIFNNAIDALNKTNEDKVIFIKLKELKQDIYMEIYDTAGGIDKEIINKIYEPYFTTKHQSQGTGLGLYMTYNILKEMQAEIKVENISLTYNSKKYTGAIFKIKMPKNLDM